MNGVLPTINFDDKSRLNACKISYETIDWHLTPEFCAKLPSPQTRPEFPLCICHFAAQSPRDTDRLQPLTLLA